MHDVADDLANDLLPYVYKAASDLLTTRQHLNRHWDDLISEGSLVLANVIAKIQAGTQIDDPPAYVFRAARRRMLAYLKQRRERQASDNIGPVHFREPRDRGRRERMEALRACCADDVDREILDARRDGQTMERIGDAVGMDKSSVSRRLEAIEQRFRATEN